MTAIPLVSVVMSVYNGEKYSEEVITSVLNQSSWISSLLQAVGRAAEKSRERPTHTFLGLILPRIRLNQYPECPTLHNLALDLRS